MATSIEWTEHTWNPITGCTKVSAGCKNCYAERMAKRLHAMGQPNYRYEFEPTTWPHMLDIPLKRKKPTMYFVCSMSDLFHEDVSFDFIDRVFAVMVATPRHTYQVLTKRPERMAEYAERDTSVWPDNIWAGTSVENRDVAHERIFHLCNVPARVHFLSCEPLLESLLTVSFMGIQWVIVGGESGPNARPMNPVWVRQIRHKCQKYNIPFFFKQWGGVNKKQTGRVLDGRTWDEMPAQSGDFPPLET